MKPMLSHATAALLVGSVILGCGLENSLVGGRCRDGFAEVGASCVSVATADAAPQDDSSVTPPPAAVDAGDSGDARTPLKFPPDDDSIVGPQNPLVPVEPVPPPPLVCVAPLVACRGVCISVTSDGQNCGACGKVCASNLCSASTCEGTTPGDVVLIGHDYTTVTSNSAQARVLANALTIPTTEPIRVLSYEDGASPEAVEQTRQLAASDLRGRTSIFTRAGSATALTSPTLDQSYDVVLIHDASGVDPVATGLSWNASLGAFASKGGVVIALDRGTSSMPQLITSAGLLAVAAHTQLPSSTRLIVSASSDVVGAQVLSPYAAFGLPVSFQGAPAPSADLTWVVRREVGITVGDPVVIHRLVR